MSTENTSFSFGQWPLRRVIVIVFVLAALTTGASRYAAAQPTQTAATGSVAAIDTTTLPTPIAVYGAPVCDGTVIDTGCALVEGDQPGPVVALGYASAAQARFHCVGGSVITLYRQHMIVGYGCNRGQR